MDDFIEKALDEQAWEAFSTTTDYRQLFSDIATNKFTRQEIDQIYREMAPDDTYFTMRYLLGREDLNDPFIYDLFQILDSWDFWGILFLLPREWYKSTVFTVGASVKRVLKYPGTSGCILSYKAPIANAFVRTISNLINNHTILYRLFPDTLGEPGDKYYWGEDRIFTKVRDHSFNEPFLEGGGIIESAPVSKHYQYIHLEDAVTKETVKTDDSVKNAIEAIRLFDPLLTHDGRFVACGTRWAYHDPYEVLEKEGFFEVFKAGPRDDEGKIMFRDEAWLAKRRVRLGPYQFSCQIENEPNDPENHPLNEQLLRTFTTPPPVDSIKAVYIRCDPAISDDKKACEAITEVILVTKDNALYLDYLEGGIGVKVQKQRDTVCNSYKRYQEIYGVARIKVGAEKYAYQNALNQLCSEMFTNMFKAGDIPIIPVVTPYGHKGSKDGCILGLDAYLDVGHIYVRPEYLPRVSAQMQVFPLGMLKDILDVMSSVSNEIGPPIVQTGSPNTVDRFKDFVNNKTKGEPRRVCEDGVTPSPRPPQETPGPGQINKFKRPLPGMTTSGGMNNKWVTRLPSYGKPS
jgi:hypothetical protein